LEDIPKVYTFGVFNFLLKSTKDGNIMKKHDVWLADLSPSFGVEIGDVCPVVVVQNDILNTTHNSTIICPIIAQTMYETNQMTVQLQSGDANLTQNSEILVSQMRAINNQRFIKQVGVLPSKYHAILNQSVKSIFDLT
jgi:mRNA interferase MazF